MQNCHQNSNHTFSITKTNIDKGECSRATRQVVLFNSNGGMFGVASTACTSPSEFTDSGQCNSRVFATELICAGPWRMGVHAVLHASVLSHDTIWKLRPHRFDVFNFLCRFLRRMRPGGHFWQILPYEIKI